MFLLYAALEAKCAVHSLCSETPKDLKEDADLCIDWYRGHGQRLSTVSGFDRE